ncbi:MAG: hypothetical protein RSH78_05075 [Bacilli bacterium]|uniref:hypothetical protein n=1 Tax=Clostridium sp. TaxID=1506 RepID=UPI002FC5CC8B
MEKRNIKIEGHFGTWYVIDETIYVGKRYYLLEHEELGDLADCLIVDEEKNIIVSHVCNGFDDMYEELEF